MRTEFYPFENEQLKELVQQIDMYIQLLYQVLLANESGTAASVPAASTATQQKHNAAQKGSSGTGAGAAGGSNAPGNSGPDYKSTVSVEQTEKLKKRTYCLLYDFI